MATARDFADTCDMFNMDEISNKEKTTTFTKYCSILELFWNCESWTHLLALERWWARRKAVIYAGQHKHIHALNGIRTHDSTDQETEGIWCLREQFHP
jgi:hypothetical protein